MRPHVIILGVIGLAGYIFLLGANTLIPALFGADAPMWLGALSRGFRHFISGAGGWLIVFILLFGALRLLGWAGAFMALPFTRHPWR